uniref:Putative fatty acid desaturase n=1 Tax=Ixodes ricinus TaxID=34613 RepID=A0A090XCH2_IXORI
MVFTQFLMFFLLRNASWPTLLLAAYFFGGVINHALMLAIHEIAHNQAFGHGVFLPNRLFGIFANLPVGLPASISFRKYHLEHHRYQGVPSKDADLPTELEAKLFCYTGTKLLWIILQPFFYALRPVLVYPKPVTGLEVVNFLIQLAFDALVYKFCGGRVLFYMIGGSLMAMGLHPVAGHFVSEHYMFKKGYETYSYYGCLNWVTFNVGYHMEHHDFPGVPGSKLPLVEEDSGGVLRRPPPAQLVGPGAVRLHHGPRHRAVRPHQAEGSRQARRQRGVPVFRRRRQHRSNRREALCLRPREARLRPRVSGVVFFVFSLPFVKDGIYAKLAE